MKKLYFFLSFLLISFFVSAQNEPFITTWEVEGNNLSITIPTEGEGYNYTVDFGDGTVINNQTGDATHTYDSAGVYTVSISGEFPRIRFGNLFNGSFKIKSIDQWGSIEWKSMESAFKSCDNLVVSATDSPDLSQVTNMSAMFQSCSSLNTNINNWDVSNVTNMSKLFSYAISFNQPLNNWDVSNVIDMREMFESSGFNQSLNNWDVSNVEDMSRMFLDTHFNEPLNDWDVSSVNDMHGMFSKAISFNQPLNTWDVSNVTNMSWMFGSFENDFKTNIFNQPLNNWDVSSVVDMSYMFHNTLNFNQSLNNWNVSSVVDMNGMFAYAKKFNQALGDWDISNVTDVSEMFYKAYLFNQSLSNWNFNNNIDLSNFLSYCGMDINNYDLLLEQFQNLNLENKILGAHDLIFCNENIHNFLVNDKGWNIIEDDLFHNCNSSYPPDAFVFRWEDEYGIYIFDYSLQGYNYSVDFGDGTVETNVSGAISHTYDSEGIYQIVITGNIPNLDFIGEEVRSIEQWGDNQWQSLQNAFIGCSKLSINASDAPNLSQVEDLSRMFQSCTILNSNIDNWDVSNITNMEHMFYGAFNYNQPLNNWNVSNVTNMNGMFSSAESFDQPLGNWDVSSVIDMSYMFKGAEAFNKPLNDWNVSNVSIMESVFEGAINFNQPLDDWDVSNVTDMEKMFYDTEKFNQSLNNWDVSNVINMAYMFGSSFYDDDNLFNQPLNNWDVSNVTNMSYMFTGAESFNQSLDNWDVSNVVSMYGMFGGAEKFNQSLNNWDVSSVELMSYMFSNASYFNQPLNNWDVSSVTDMEEMFADAESFNRPLSNWDVSNVYDMRRMFSGAVSFNQDISNWVFQENIDLNNFIASTTLNIQNYDALLSRFVELELQDKDLQSVHGLEYCNEFIHSQLVEELNWFISGDNLAEDCSSYNLISGSVIYDENLDGCDENDMDLSGLLVTISNEDYNFGKLIDQSGTYNFYLELGTYEVQITNPSENYTVSPANDIVVFENSSSATQEEINFCLTATQTVEDLNITLLPVSQARPGFEADYRLVVENMGTQTVSLANVSLLFDETKQSFVVAIPAESSSSTNELNFEVNDLSPFNQQVFNFTMQTFQPPTVNGDDILAFTATVTPNTNDYTPEDNTFDYDQVVVNSYDPNDKQVLQGDEVHIDDADQYLDYLIRFQNTGTASAINVRIVDTLHPNLDYNTIRPVSASHDYRVEITDGNHVEFIFEDINLPDENSDEPGSHGFIAYKIKPKENVAVGDFVTGDAQIYFDFNEPIITNMVSTQFVEDLSVNEYDKSRTISIYPNPTTGILNIQKNTTLELNEINIYNLQGKRLLNFSENLEKLTIENLSAGIYLLQIQTNQGVINKQLIKN